MSDDSFYGGIDDFQKQLTEILSIATDEGVKSALLEAGETLAYDVRRLPKPRSQISKSGYTHLIDTVRAAREDGKIVVGWGKYYGPILENGSMNMGAQPHLKPMWERNKEKYQRKMVEKLKLGG